MTGRDLAAGLIELVRLDPADAGELLTVQRSAYAEQARLHHDPHLPPLTETLSQLRAELASAEVVTLGLRRAGRLVAAVRLRTPLGGSEAMLSRLVVVPDLQGSGLGTRLLLAVEAVVPQHVRCITLFTGEHSATNLTLYTRHGYVETHRTDAGAPPPAPPYQLVHLAKSLRRAGQGTMSNEPPSS
ncbi:MAG: GNAT family N-acetyltransferase [Kineosporiaceae bacterium]